MRALHDVTTISGRPETGTVILAQDAMMLGVQFAGTAVLQSEDRQLQIHGQSETDIANGILRVSQGAKQLICFLDGHGEADPFSLESHDHLEGTADHSHGLGAQYVLHERHGLAKARHGLEALNYQVEKISLIQSHDTLSACALLIVVGPKTALLPAEVEAIRVYLASGGNGFFMLDPFVTTGLEPVLALISRMRADRRVRPKQDLKHYGLDNPQAIIAFYGRQGKGIEASQLLDVLSVGDLLPTQYAYYTMRAGDTELALIPRYYIALLLASVFGAEQAPAPLPSRDGIGSR